MIVVIIAGVFVVGAAIGGVVAAAALLTYISKGLMR
jgi:hypothetical protein